MQASAAASFIDSVGVVTHLSYTDTPYYTDFPQILTALQSLGVHHIRDGYYPWPASSPVVQAHHQLAAAGIKCDYVVSYNSATTAQAIESFAPEVGDMESLEAPNECDLDGNCGVTGAIGLLNMIAFLPTIKAAADNLNVPLLGPSLTQQASYLTAGILSSDMTVNNLHIYFDGRNPGNSGWGIGQDAKGNAYGSFAWWLDQAAIDAPGLPSLITETGYMAYTSTTTPYTLPESVEASYIPRTLLLAYNLGFQKTYLYELLDEASSPGYGLLNSDLTPKPAFTAVQNLLSVLNDRANSSFAPGSLQFSLSGGDSTLNHLLLEKQDGSFWLVLWLEQSSWNPATDVPIAVTPEDITINLSSSYQASTDYQFDTNGNVTPFSQSMQGNSTSLTVSDQV
ncbi:MAG: Ricin B lectin, partial [Terracidiphilus sp.]